MRDETDQIIDEKDGFGMGECSRTMSAQGRSTPRTCAICGLGPCRDHRSADQQSVDQLIALLSEDVLLALVLALTGDVGNLRVVAGNITEQKRRITFGKNPAGIITRAEPS